MTPIDADSHDGTGPRTPADSATQARGPHSNNQEGEPEGQLGDFEPTCPDCALAVGDTHIHDEDDGGCDIARCLVTGYQRLMCDLDHDCGRDVWTGWWPGQVFPVKSAC